MDESGFGRHAAVQRAGEDGAELAAGPLLLVHGLASHGGRGLQVQVLEVVDPIARSQIDPTAQEAVGVVQPQRSVAGLLVPEMDLATQDVSKSIQPQDRADAAGVIVHKAVREGEPPGAVAVTGGELQGPAKGILPRIIELGIAGDDGLAAGLLADDDVRDDREALHVDAGGAAAHQFDPFNLADQDARQNAGASVVLGCRTRSVDQDIAHRTLEASAAVAIGDAEARDAADHVQSRDRPLSGKEVRREDQHALLAGFGLWRGSRDWHALRQGRGGKRQRERRQDE